MKCEKCGFNNSQKNNFCQECGSSFQEEMIPAPPSQPLSTYHKPQESSPANGASQPPREMPTIPPPPFSQRQGGTDYSSSAGDIPNQGYQVPSNEGYQNPSNQGYQSPQNQGYQSSQNQGYPNSSNQNFQQGYDNPTSPVKGKNKLVFFIIGGVILIIVMLAIIVTSLGKGSSSPSTIPSNRDKPIVERFDSFAEQESGRKESYNSVSKEKGESLDESVWEGVQAAHGAYLSAKGLFDRYNSFEVFSSQVYEESETTQEILDGVIYQLEKDVESGENEHEVLEKYASSALHYATNVQKYNNFVLESSTEDVGETYPDEQELQISFEEYASLRLELLEHTDESRVSVVEKQLLDMSGVYDVFDEDGWTKPDIPSGVDKDFNEEHLNVVETGFLGYVSSLLSVAASGEPEFEISLEESIEALNGTKSLLNMIKTLNIVGETPEEKALTKETNLFLEEIISFNEYFINELESGATFDMDDIFDHPKTNSVIDVMYDVALVRQKLYVSQGYSETDALDIALKDTEDLLELFDELDF